MSGASGEGDRGGKMQANITQYTGRHLLVRQPQTLATKVPLDGVVISQLKQEMPVFHAIELTALCERFGKTAFEKATVSMWLLQWNNLVHMELCDQRKNVPLEYKERCRRRESALSIEAFADILKSITDKGIVRILNVIKVNDSLLKLFLQAENLSPVRFELMIESSDSTKEYLVPLMQRFAKTGKVQRASLSFDLITDGHDWQQLEECLAPYTSLQRLHLELKGTPPPSDWLKNATVVNSQLKQLKIDALLYFSPVVADAISHVGRIGDIRIGHCNTDQLMNHVELDLCGGGQCTLTKLALTMPETGRLTWEIYAIDDGDDFYGDMLRLGYYLLSLHKTGKAVAVKVKLFPAGRMQEFAEDLSHFFPHTDTKMGAGGHSYDYRIGVKRVSIYFFSVEDEQDEDDEEDTEEDEAYEEN